MGLNVDKYVVDLMMKTSSLLYGINNYGIGTYYDSYEGGSYASGVYYKNLQSNSITVYCAKDSNLAQQIRVRIWVTN